MKNAVAAAAPAPRPAAWVLAMLVLLTLLLGAVQARAVEVQRSEEHTSELQSLMRISYAVFCLKKKKFKISHNHYKYYNIPHAHNYSAHDTYTTHCTIISNRL